MSVKQNVKQILRVNSFPSKLLFQKGEIGVLVQIMDLYTHTIRWVTCLFQSVLKGVKVLKPAYDFNLEGAWIIISVKTVLKLVADVPYVNICMSFPALALPWAL